MAEIWQGSDQAHGLFKQSGTTRMTTSKSYDYLNRLTAISSTPSAAAASSFNYNYNSANQRVQSALVDGSYWSYNYDSLGQVTSGKKYWVDGTPVAGQQFDYAFDTIGNRNSTKSGGDETGANQRVASYTNNTLNQVTGRDVPGYVDIKGISLATNTVSVAGLAAYRKGEYFRKELSVSNGSVALWTNIVVAATGQTSTTGNVFVAKAPEVFTYDLDGNLTGDGRWTYGWDAENRLTNMTSLTSAPTGSKLKLDFAFDAQGRRIQKIVSTNSGAAFVGQYTNKFVYDGWNLIAVLNPASALVSSYVWGSDLSGSAQGAGGVGGLLEAVNYGVSTNFVAFDGNGNVAALVKVSDGTVTANYEYGPFGEVIRASGPMAKANPFRFSTKYQDDESDLLYYGYRFYNQSQGRWLSRDPLEERGGFNLQGFLVNNAVHGFDVLGLWHWAGGKRQRKPFATVVADQCGDPYRDLAILVSLDADEVQKWLITYKPNQDVKTGDEFMVPNIVYINRNVTYPWFWISYAISEINALTEQGYFVLYSVDVDNDTVRRQWANPAIFGYIHVAHGVIDIVGQRGELETTDLRGIAPNMISPHHKLGGLKVVECWGGHQNWIGHVSRNAILQGNFWAYDIELQYWNMPARGF